MPAYSNTFPEAITAKESDYLYTQTSGIVNAGLGLFSSIAIYKNEIVAIYLGEKLLKKEAILRTQLKNDAYFINLPNGAILDSHYTPCFAKYANDANGLAPFTHKNNANIVLNHKNQVCLVAIKTIKAHSEIFCSYGKLYWQHFEEEKINR
jgi:uncharacterized protein